MKKPVVTKTTLRPTKGFQGLFKVKKEVKHLKPDEEIHLNVIHLYLAESRVQIFNDSTEPIPFMLTIPENEFSDYFTEIL
jgi:hypothetical protein